MTQISPIYLLRDKAVNEEIDYTMVSACLQDYAAPRDVITRFLREGSLIRVKKGLYVFGERYRRRYINLEVLANQIYGPSYLSCEYVLQYYGLIPEGVYELTSMTTKRNKFFKTPLGNFRYHYLAVNKFVLGVTLKRLSENQSVMIATPEKALVDYIHIRKEGVENVKELVSILIEDYRIDEEELSKLNIQLMKRIVEVYKNATLNFLPEAIREINNA